MKSKIKILLVSFIFLLSLSACSKQGEASTDNSSTGQEISQTETEQSQGFDIEVARKNIIIKGQPFEIPVALGDLKDGWTWKESDKSWALGTGKGLAELYLNGEEWFTAGLNNYYKGDEENGTIYNLTIKTEDCSIDGLVPYQSTKQDVVGKYGEPNEVDQEYDIYYYRPEITVGVIDDQVLTIRFDENDMVIKISITYSD